MGKNFLFLELLFFKLVLKLFWELLTLAIFLIAYFSNLAFQKALIMSPVGCQPTVFKRNKIFLVKKLILSAELMYQFYLFMNLPYFCN
jgi:hypothetical protein